MSFKIGTKYVYSSSRTIAVCVGVDLNNCPIMQDPETKRDAWTSYQSELWKEYKEPVVHRRDVIWLKAKSNHSCPPPDGVCVVILRQGEKPWWKEHWVEVKRQTVEYTEEF